MSDMLVKLYELPSVDPSVAKLQEAGVTVRRAMAYEKYQVVEWIEETFGEGWASEFGIAFSNRPISCFIATSGGRVLGAACYDCTCKDFFGPLGVAQDACDRGIGRALLLSCLHSMEANGYAYAIIGDAKPASFYAHVVTAAEIPGSAPGIYRDRLEDLDI